MTLPMLGGTVPVTEESCASHCVTCPVSLSPSSAVLPELFFQQSELAIKLS